MKFNSFLCKFVENKPIINDLFNYEDVPAASDLSDLISKDLKRASLKFANSTIVYSFIQLVGMINDHFNYCSFKNIQVA
ncbi:DNA-3-methyladenine glycosylase I [Mycoplasmopsis opalescens]|uniref:DNA-3-methyladenine glycosylase I n=1 Tax=Mycoplasmopsis opalescens TaxID=114886 RepID=UPI000A008598